MAIGQEVLMVEVKDIDVDGRLKPYTRDGKVHEWLEKTPVKNWLPINLIGNQIVDGLQRVMFAIEYNIEEIPGIIR